MDNKKKNRSPLKNPLLIFLVISVIATVILNMVMLSLQTPKKQEISYSDTRIKVYAVPLASSSMPV